MDLLTPAISLLLLLGAAVPTPAQGNFNLIRNGSFEILVDQGIPVHPWTPVPSLLVNWGNAPHGANYAHIDFISQTVSTVPGLFYNLSFSVASDLFINPVGTVQIQWGDTILPPMATAPRPYNENINRYEQINWERFTVPNLAASSSSTTLSFRAIAGSQLLLDNVTLTVVPEPSTAALIISAGMLFSTLRRRP